MSNLSEKITIGEDVKRFMDHPVMQAYFLGYKAELVQGIIDAPVRDAVGVHELKIMIQQLEKFHAHMKHYIDTGKIAAVQLEHDKKVAEFKRNNKFA